MFLRYGRTHLSQHGLGSFCEPDRGGMIAAIFGGTGAPCESRSDPDGIADRSGDCEALVVQTRRFIGALLCQVRVPERTQRHAEAPTVADLTEDRYAHGLEFVDCARWIAFEHVN